MPGNTVKMKVTEALERGGTRTYYRTFKIEKAELNKPSWHWRYTLLAADGDPYEGGAWVKEDDLRAA